MFKGLSMQNPDCLMIVLLLSNTFLEFFGI